MKKKILLSLRFILILCTVLVMTYSKKGLAFPEPGYTIALVYLFSNLALYLLPEKIFHRPFISFMIFLFDIVTISLAIYFVQGAETDFFLIYFLVIFIASVSQDIGGSLPTAIVASIVYGWLIYRSNPGMSIFSPTLLLRVPFLFIISLISSYWSASTRRELKKKAELERFTKELETEVNRIAAEEIEFRKYTEKIINSVPSGVIAVSNDGIITTLNPEAERVLRYKSEKVVGSNIQSMPGMSSLWKKMQTSIDTRETLKRGEVSIQNKDGHTIPIGLSISPIEGAKNRFSGCVVIFKDLSEIKALQEKLNQAEKLSYLGKMASWVAHEIRNPLAAIDGFAQLLTTAKTKEKLELYRSEIQKGTRRINNIIDDILAFAKSKKQKPEYVNIDLKKLVEDIIRNINTQYEINGMGEPIVQGETESIRRVFVNLITNAVEALDDNGLLQVNFTDNHDGIITNVIDNGEGIPQENMKNLFTPFFTTKQRGTGLGLAIVKKIVEEHNGTIGIESEIGKGTSITVRLLKTIIDDEHIHNHVEEKKR